MSEETSETVVHDDARHAEKMAKKKAARDKIMATKTGEKGLIIVHTGKGKGKSTAGFGMIFRHIAHGMPCAVVQFIKGAMETGERELIESADVNAICSRRIQDRVFDLIAAIGSRQADRALAIYMELLSLQTPPQIILSLMGRPRSRLVTATPQRKAGIALPRQMARA